MSIISPELDLSNIKHFKMSEIFWIFVFDMEVFGNVIFQYET